MIRHIEDASLIDKNKLIKTCCGRRILSYLRAYGTGYDFCRFFINDSGSVMLLINSTLLISGEEFNSEELVHFAYMNKPFRIEGSDLAIELLTGIDGYKKLHRTIFKLKSDNTNVIDEQDINFAPKLDDVYEILTEGFPNLLDYQLWLADTSHRVRHGLSRVFTFKEATTASITYDIDGFVLVSQVATKISARGSGFARIFLKWLADYIEKQNKTAFLYALDTRESFYREIGFEVYNDEYVLERIDKEDENSEKGKLN